MEWQASHSVLSLQRIPLPLSAQPQIKGYKPAMTALVSLSCLLPPLLLPVCHQLNSPVPISELCMCPPVTHFKALPSNEQAEPGSVTERGPGLRNHIPPPSSFSYSLSVYVSVIPIYSLSFFLSFCLSPYVLSVCSLSYLPYLLAVLCGSSFEQKAPAALVP